jgi:hypothetical protein
VPQIGPVADLARDVFGNIIGPMLEDVEGDDPLRSKQSRAKQTFWSPTSGTISGVKRE